MAWVTSEIVRLRQRTIAKRGGEALKSCALPKMDVTLENICSISKEDGSDAETSIQIFFESGGFPVHKMTPDSLVRPKMLTWLQVGRKEKELI